MLADSLAVIGLSWSWIRRGVVRNLHWQTRRVMEFNLQRTWWQISQDPVIQYFAPPVPLREENDEAKEEARRQYSSMVAVYKEQQQIYATKYPSLLGLRWNLQHLIIWKRRRFLLARLLQKILPMHSNGETKCKNTSENSNNCQKTRNYLNYVLMRDAENTRCLAMNRGLVWEDGFARIQDSVQCWT